MSIKHLAKSLVPDFLWREVRRMMIIKNHYRVEIICENLLLECERNNVTYEFRAKHTFDSDRIIWQYWSQGYDDAPPIVKDCLASVDNYCQDYVIVRLDDANLSQYIDFPDWFLRKRDKMSLAHFSDVLRVVLLYVYGGIWMDATIMLTSPIPEAIGNLPFFVFRRDDKEPNKAYWENSYAYYFGWHKHFKVRMLNSFIVSRRGLNAVSEIKNALLAWWERHDDVPDYFFFQVLYEVMIDKGHSLFDCRVESDTLPHYMQQSINDSSFSLVEKDKIPDLCWIHKLTYKKEKTV